MRRAGAWMMLLGMAACVHAGKKGEVLSPLDQYIQEATVGRAALGQSASPGSLFQPSARLAELGRDFRANSVDDLVTVVVSDRASAVARGVANSSRKSSTQHGVSAMLGPLAAGGALPNLLGTSGDTKLQGQGETSRSNTLNTTLTTRVTHVLPNGNLVLSGVKEVVVNSERQLIELRGVIRPDDLAGGNSILSDRVGMLEVRVNGKGVVGDAVRRPFFLYRLLLGILPL